MPVVESREEKTTAETEREHFLLRRASVIRKDDEAKSTFLFLPFNSVAFRCVGAESSRSSAENYNRPGPARLDPAHRLLVQGSSVTSRYKFLFFFFRYKDGPMGSIQLSLCINISSQRSKLLHFSCSRLVNIVC